MENIYDYKKWTFIAGTVALATIALLAFVMSVSEWKTVKRGGQMAASISVNGEGEITAVPDIATVTFTVRESAKTVPEAQKAVEAKIVKAISSLTALSIDKKDTKTTSYIVSPKYETQNIYCVTIPCPNYKTVIIGYEVAETISVKIRNIDKAGDALGGLGGLSITEINGPDFAVDDMDAAQASAKEKAIANAQEKAEKTARALGVSLGSIVQFSEDNGGYYPSYYGVNAMSAKAADSVSVPQGESVIKSRVTIVYSIN
jgi:uncharacterized protein YggE